MQSLTTKLVPELMELMYEERLKDTQLTMLKERREREDLNTIYKPMNEMERAGKLNLLLTRGETREMSGHNGKLRKGRCSNNVKFSFPQRNVDICNKVKDEVIMVNCV